MYAGFGEFDSLYIGGGTPSLLDDRQITELISGLMGTFRFAGVTEVTVEMNPDDVAREKLGLYGSLGVNRISLGVQSFVEEEVRFLCRRHTARQAVSALEAIAGAGFREYSIDLMYGLPGQSVETWQGTLQRALSFHPDHLSCYQLTVEGDTPFSRMAKEGALAMPDDALQADLFVSTSEYLTGSGFIHYEVSNFARGTERLARHNVKYWQHTPYLGLGPSAHSFTGQKRWWDIRDAAAYIEAVQEGRIPVEGSEDLLSSQMNLEKLLFGSRTMWGINVRDVVPPLTEERISGLCDSGFVTIEDEHILPTLKGYLFADKLPLLIS
jgi:oxygen-independent coproporphyrinogen-3 oxidase